MKDKNPGVIFFHGMTSSEKGYIPIAKKLAEYGVVGLTLNIRGHGTSGGDFNNLSISDAVQDGLNAYDFFVNHNFLDPVRIGILGSSLGGAVAVCISEKRKVKNLVLRAPADYSEDMLKITYSQIMSDVYGIFMKMNNISNTQAVRAISKFEGSLLVVTSGRDEIIPSSITTQYILDAKKAQTKKQIVIENAAHTLTNENWRKQFVDEAVKWFIETLDI